jgi:hypothetical protein
MAWVCGYSLIGIAGSNPAGCMYVCRVCCVLSLRGLCDGWSLVQMSPTDCGVSERDLATPLNRRPWPAVGKRKLLLENNFVDCKHFRLVFVKYFVSTLTGFQLSSAVLCCLSRSCRNHDLELTSPSYAMFTSVCVLWSLPDQGYKNSTAEISLINQLRTNVNAQSLIKINRKNAVSERC